MTWGAAEIEISDDRVAAGGDDLSVVDTSANEVHRVTRDAGHVVVAIGLGRTSLYTADAQPGTAPVRFDSIRHYDLNCLAEFSTRTLSAVHRAQWQDV